MPPGSVRVRLCHGRLKPGVHLAALIPTPQPHARLGRELLGNGTARRLSQRRGTGTDRIHHGASVPGNVSASQLSCSIAPDASARADANPALWSPEHHASRPARRPFEPTEACACRRAGARHRRPLGDRITAPMVPPIPPHPPSAAARRRRSAAARRARTLPARSARPYCSPCTGRARISSSGAGAGSRRLLTASREGPCSASTAPATRSPARDTSRSPDASAPAPHGDHGRRPAYTGSRR